MLGEPVVANINIKLHLKETQTSISNKILSSLATEINKRLLNSRTVNSLTSVTKNVLSTAIMAQPEYVSLVSEGGVLRTELGLVDSSERMNALINILLDSVKTTVTPAQKVGNIIIGRLMITAVPNDYTQLLSSQSASYTTEKGTVIPWLEWLLLKGDSIIIATHDIEYGEDLSQSSRTGYSIMLPSESGWRVPSEFSGTADDNFITRAITFALPYLRTSIEAEIRRRL